MSATAKAKIAEELALLSQVVDFPQSPFGYGSDISCDQDVDPNVEEVEANTTLAMAQAIVRRLDTPRGSLPDDQDYGIDVRSKLNKGMTDADVRALAGQIRSEILKDDRVDLVSVTVSPNSVGSELRIEIFVTPVDYQIGGFGLTLNASSAAILIAEIKAAT